MDPIMMKMAIAGVAGFVLGVVVTKLCCKGGKKGCKASASAQPPKFKKVHQPPADGSIEIYVGNLSYDLSEDTLRKEFEAFGTVNSCRIVTNKYNGHSKGFAFVHMPNRAEADAACAALNGKELNGRKIKCNEAQS